ncbi:MAG: tRNA (adenosine(37)-N6)-threonylcarbamoyltransferase complex transferase subunit TsaD [Burkholderiaceae bacterium]|jgi:N6-L-threonylcarbamoyladenine synthase|nr:tRNA (adenosine(37)-N6)-threonylcarbamoyltransferase complex transferase subunit TsaD [Burkholderiales bacterium]MCZ8339127.1 tRNA (adenosine(37)-N6)-threonylcarbamoyltransferase complex transferase subunit TsaD [Burkholderiaceae bacterium]
MLTLGIETSCDETGVALHCERRGLLAQALHSQVAMHERYGGVVPELASRDHIRRLLPLARQVLDDAGVALADVDAIAYTEGPGLAGALLVGAAVAQSLGYALRVPTIGVHHLEGHLLSPLLSADPPSFPFVALLVSGGHTQLLRVDGVGRYALLGESVDDAAGEAFDKSAKLLGLGYPGGPAIARLAESGTPGRFDLPRPKLHSDDLDFSFSGLKTAVATRIARGLPDAGARADLAAEVQAAIVDVLVAKSLAALRATGLGTLVIAGGVSANRRLRERLAEASARDGLRVHCPEPALCTDNGAMIAFAGSLRLRALRNAGAPLPAAGAFDVRPRWPLEALGAA